MKIFNGVDELSDAVGQRLGISDWYDITQERVDMFASATGDDQWIHVDPERATAGPYHTTIAHGYLTLGIIPTLTRQVYRVDGVQAGINYGTNRVRFPSPVAVDSRVRAAIDLESVTAAAGGTQVITNVTIECAGVERPACVAQVVSLLVP